MNENITTLSITRNVIVTKQDIDDIVFTALDDGCRYWVRLLHLGSKGASFSKPIHKAISEGKSIFFVEDEGGMTHELYEGNLLLGLKEYLQHYDSNAVIRKRGIDTSYLDADQADIIIQLAVFGEVRYG